MIKPLAYISCLLVTAISILPPSILTLKENSKLGDIITCDASYSSKIEKNIESALILQGDDPIGNILYMSKSLDPKCDIFILTKVKSNIQYTGFVSSSNKCIYVKMGANIRKPDWSHMVRSWVSSPNTWINSTTSSPLYYFKGSGINENDVRVINNTINAAAIEHSDNKQNQAGFIKEFLQDQFPSYQIQVLISKKEVIYNGLVFVRDEKWISWTKNWEKEPLNYIIYFR